MIYILSAIFLYLFFGLLLYIFQRKILFNPSGKPFAPSYYGLTGTDINYILTDDGISLLSWTFIGDNKKPLIIYFHGNSFDIGERAYRLKKYIDLNYSILIVAWRGYSGNEGKPSEKNLYRDGEATINWVLKNTKFNLNNIIIYGESLGTGVAVELSTRYKFLLTVLEAPFTSISDIAKNKYKIYPTKFLVKDKFDNLSKIDKINSPLIVISGKRDEIIPHNQSVILFKKAKVLKKSVFIDEAMHNNLYDFGIEKNIINFSLKLWKLI